jgi:hypothetical protein
MNYFNLHCLLLLARGLLGFASLDRAFLEHRHAFTFEL